MCFISVNPTVKISNVLHFIRPSRKRAGHGNMICVCADFIMFCKLQDWLTKKKEENLSYIRWQNRVGLWWFLQGNRQTEVAGPKTAVLQHGDPLRRDNNQKHRNNYNSLSSGWKGLSSLTTRNLTDCCIPCTRLGSPEVCSASAGSWRGKRWRECGGGPTGRPGAWSWSHRGSLEICWDMKAVKTVDGCTFY